VQTATYTAASGQLVQANATTASLTVTLPAATAGLRVGVTKVNADTSGNTVTIAAAGSDTISGTTVLRLPGETRTYTATAGQWVMDGGATTLASTDGRYLTSTRLSPGTLWAFCGDSITNGSDATNFAYAFPSLATQYAGQAVARLDFHEAGTAGYTSTGLLAYMPAILAFSPKPNAVHVQIGTNDASQLVPLATYQANVAAIVALAKAAGCAVTIGTVPPRDGATTTAAINLLTAAYNAWLRLWGPQQGCIIAETYGALADPTTGNLIAAYNNSDGPHPNNAGHEKLAQVVAAAMKAAAAATPPSVLRPAKDSLSLVSNPLMAGTGPFPTNWAEWSGGTGTAPTYSTFADTTGILPGGQWAQMDFDGTTAGGTRRFYSTGSFTGVTIGDVCALTGIMLIEDVSGTWETDVVAGTAAAGPQILTDGAVNLAAVFDRSAGLNLGKLFGNGNTVYQYGPFAIPVTTVAGQAGFLIWNNVTIPTGKHVKARFGCIDLIDLTTSGLSGVLGSTRVPINHNGP
jgi:lysophospholipase L1-like esterase